MEEIHTQSVSKPHSRLNILPILIIAGIIYILFTVDLDSSINSPQFQKNLNYIKTSIKKIMPKNNINLDSFSKVFQIPKLPPLNVPLEIQSSVKKEENKYDIKVDTNDDGYIPKESQALAPIE